MPDLMVAVLVLNGGFLLNPGIGAMYFIRKLECRGDVNKFCQFVVIRSFEFESTLLTVKKKRELQLE